MIQRYFVLFTLVVTPLFTYGQSSFLHSPEEVRGEDDGPLSGKYSPPITDPGSRLHVSLFPNPSDGSFFIDLSKSSYLGLQINQETDKFLLKIYRHNDMSSPIYTLKGLYPITRRINLNYGAGTYIVVVSATGNVVRKQILIY